MSSMALPRVAIVDYGMGNLYSVQRACQQTGLGAYITSSKAEVQAADAVILPGVGAFGDAMDTLIRLDLVSPLLAFASSGKPLVGICLGMQLLMTDSQEFGHHDGLGIIDGEVVRLMESSNGKQRVKIPQVGWNRVCAGCPDQSGNQAQSTSVPWLGTPLEGIPDGEFMYFVHSFYPKPANRDIVLSTTRYGEIEFCSSLCSGNIFACQFHPERSGLKGLQVYHNLAMWIRASMSESLDA